MPSWWKMSWQHKLKLIMNTEFEGAKKPQLRCSQEHGTRMLNNLHSSEVKKS